MSQSSATLVLYNGKKKRADGNVPDMNVSHVDLDVVHDALYQFLHESFLQ